MPSLLKLKEMLDFFMFWGEVCNNCSKFHLKRNGKQGQMIFQKKITEGSFAQPDVKM